MGQPLHNSAPEPIVLASLKDETSPHPERAPTEGRRSAEPVFTIEIADGPSDVLQSTEHAEQLIRQYVQELKTEIAIGVESLPPPGSGRRLLWGLGFGVVAASLTLCLLLWSQSQMLTASGQAAALHAAEVCAGRQTEVMDAIADYTRDHGEAPADLASLTKDYLDVQPSDPSTGEPFNYARQGGVVWLACPRHPLPPVLQTPGEPPPSVPPEVADASAVAPEGTERSAPENENGTDQVVADVDVASPERRLPPE